MSDQLDLFSGQPKSEPSSADMIPFPCKHRVGKARRVAEVILSQPTDKASASYWRSIIGTMDRQMRKAGVADDRIERELDAFKALVQRILDAQPADQVQR